MDQNKKKVKTKRWTHTLGDYFITKRTLELCSIAVAHSIKKSNRVKQTSTEAHPFQITFGHQKRQWTIENATWFPFMICQVKENEGYTKCFDIKKGRRWHTWPMNAFCGLIRWRMRESVLSSLLTSINWATAAVGKITVLWAGQRSINTLFKFH